MTRRMLDALYPNLIPISAVQPGDMIAAYVGHSANPQSYAQAVARFAGHQIVSIAARTHGDAQVLDIEHGAVEPTDYATINAWCDRQRFRGVYPTLYMNTSTWPAVRPHLDGPVNWWAAKWNGQPVIPAGAVGVQYSGVPGYDISVMNDWIAGIDAGDHDPAGDGGDPITPPHPQPAQPTEDDDMPLNDTDKAWLNDAIRAAIKDTGPAAILAHMIDPHTVDGPDLAPGVTWPPASTLQRFVADIEVRTGRLESKLDTLIAKLGA